MSIKNILEFTILFSLIVFITSIEENSEKFLSHSLFEASKDIKSFASKGDSKLINIKCIYSEDYNIYSLQALLKKNDDYKYEDNDNNTIIFNFCRNTHIIDNATFVKNNSGTLVRLTGSIDGEEESKNQWSQTKDGISISFVEGDYCKENGTEKHSLKLIINCDGDVEGKDFLKTFNYSISSNPCQHTIKMSSLYGCSLRSTYLLLKIFLEYKIVFTIIFILVGIGLCFFGNRFIKWTIILISGFIGCYALTAVVLKFFPNFITSESYLLICLLICFVLGCVIGYFIKDDEKMYIPLLGAGLGYFCATFLYQIVQNYVNFDPEIVYYACIGICVVVGAFIAWKLTKPIVILATSIFGGYLIMRGVSLVAGNYLDEGLVIDLIKNKEWDQLKEMRGGWIYAYLGSWIVLSVLGVFIQCKNKNKSKSDDVEK